MMAEMLDRVTPTMLHGVLNVFKPAGWTSHDVVAKVRRLLQVSKVGHAGTLDPEATGVLPVLLGKGTRLSSFLLHWDKDYEVVLRLGQETTTQDATGELVRARSIQGMEHETVCDVIRQFQGDQWQVPPMYSAVKMGGQPLYKAARAGKILDRQARAVTIYHLEVRAMDLPDVTLRVCCSKGTYMRTLCADIGQRLGVGGHLSRLIRMRVGPLRLDQAWTIDDIGNHDDLTKRHGAFLNLDEALAHLPVVTVDSAVVGKVLHGMPVSEAAVEVEGDREYPTDTLMRVKDERERFLALGKWVPSGVSGYQLQMVKVFGETLPE